MNRSKAKEIFVKFYCKNRAFCELHPDRCKKEGCEIYHAIKAIEAEPQRAYEQGVKDTLDKYDETFRIASDIRCAMGCKTSKECRELIGNGEIQRVKLGKWTIMSMYEYRCSICGAIHIRSRTNYCPNCGAKMQSTMGQVKHGHWVKYGSPLFSEWECSECGERHTGNDLPDKCPHCKAIMDEDKTEMLEAWDLDGSPTRYIKAQKNG